MLPDAIRRAALFPASDLLPLPKGHPNRRETIGGVVVQSSAGLPMAFVSPERMDPTTLDAVVEDVRALLRSRAFRRAVWMVAEAAEPSGLAARLRALGMRPSDEPSIEPRSTAMVIAAPPPPGPPEIVARPAASFDEFLATQRITSDAFGMDDELRRAFEQRAERVWTANLGGEATVTFVALSEGEIVAFGHAALGRTALFMAGGGTRPDRRGQGAYRALVRARWDLARARGLSALTVDAGAQSRPVLERCGFVSVGGVDHLVDDLVTV